MSEGVGAGRGHGSPAEQHVHWDFEASLSGDEGLSGWRVGQDGARWCAGTVRGAGSWEQAGWVTDWRSPHAWGHSHDLRGGCSIPGVIPLHRLLRPFLRVSLQVRAAVEPRRHGDAVQHQRHGGPQRGGQGLRAGGHEQDQGAGRGPWTVGCRQGVCASPGLQLSGATAHDVTGATPVFHWPARGVGGPSRCLRATAKSWSCFPLAPRPTAAAPAAATPPSSTSSPRGPCRRR